MGKLLSWVVLIALAWFVIHLVTISQRRRERGRDASDSTGTGAAPRTLPGEPIVPCDRCGVFVPASDAIRHAQRTYCSVAHRDADRSGPAARDRGRSRDE